MLSGKYLSYWLLLGLFTETVSATIGLKWPSGNVFFSFLFFFAGLTISVLILFFKPGRLVYPQFRDTGYLESAGKAVMLLLLASATLYFFLQIVRENDIDVTSADMLPVIKVMNQRLLQGEWHSVYHNIPSIWNGVQPIYLPAMWIPYLPAVAFDFDMRWITLVSLFMVFAVFLLLLRGGTKPIFNIVLLTSGLMLWWWLLLEDDMHGLVSMSEEGVVVLYMILLVLAILTDRIFPIAIAACLCLLSRYAMIGWVPAFIAYLVMNGNMKKAGIFCITGICMLVVFFILPFGWNSLIRLLQVPGKYISFSNLVWKDNPGVFTGSLGFAKFFVSGKMKLLHYLLIALSFLVPAGFMAACMSLRKKKYICNIPLATLKLSLVVFYNFVDVPYLYLFYTSSLVSLVSVTFLISSTREQPVGQTC